MSDDNRENRNPFAGSDEERPPASRDDHQASDQNQPEVSEEVAGDNYTDDRADDYGDEYTDDYDDEEIEYEFEDDENDDLDDILPQTVRAQLPPLPAGSITERRHMSPPLGDLPDPVALEDDLQDYEDDDDPDWDDYDDNPPGNGNGNGNDGPSFSESWPLGLIAVAAIALLLLAAGGYGVMQQRAALTEEVRELQAQLAMASSPEEIAGERVAQRELTQRNAALEATLAGLRLENRQLTDTVDGLEAQLESQRAVADQAPVQPAPAAKAEARVEASTSKPESAPASTAAATPAAAADDTGWFVNFGSYSQREMAQSWSNRLQPASGEVVVNSADAGGTTVYRVRVVNLDSRDAAENVARSLEQQYKLSKLWVGRQ